MKDDEEIGKSRGAPPRTLVVFLALYGSIKTAKMPVADFDSEVVVAAMAVWAFGLMAAALTSYFGYRSQSEFRKGHDAKR